MSIHGQKIEKIYVTQLKGLKNAQIDFDKSLTAIVGPNCSGKTTILDALACVYKESGSFGDYFIPSKYCDWADSEFEVEFSYKEREKEKVQNTTYKKGKDRWLPVASRRPERNVYYFRTNDEVPICEKVGRKEPLFYYDIDESDIKNETSIIERSRSILFQEYNSIKSVNLSSIPEMFTVGNESTSYLSLDMGAGEQKILKYLMFLSSIEKFSLVLIDEIDIFIHSRSFKMFIEELNRIAEAKKLQIVFTTHSEMIIQFSDLIDIKYLFKTKDKTLVLDKPNNDIIYRLSGERKKEYEIYVEDSLSETIVREVAGELGIRRKISICCFGAASNCFTIATGLKLKGYENYCNALFVIDGDEYKEPADKLTMVNKNLTGNTDIAKKQRLEVLERIVQYNLPSGKKPEEYIAEIFLNIVDKSRDIEEIKTPILENKMGSNKHDIINKSLDELNYDKKSGFSKIIDCIKKEELYCNFVNPIKEELLNMIEKNELE